MFTARSRIAQTRIADKPYTEISADIFNRSISGYALEAFGDVSFVNKYQLYAEGYAYPSYGFIERVYKQYKSFTGYSNGIYGTNTLNLIKWIVRSLELSASLDKDIINQAKLDKEFYLDAERAVEIIMRGDDYD